MFQIKTTAVGMCVLMSLCACTQAPSLLNGDSASPHSTKLGPKLLWGVNGSASIQANAHGSPLVITTSDRLAGAIGSLNWAGKEFINNYDHGRELQSAVSFDNLGECLNPTEAGGGYDGGGSTSTSQLIGISASGNQLSTETQMAYWTAAGSAYPAGCGGNSAVLAAQNRVNISNEVLYKTVTIGAQGLDNVIQYDVGLWVPEAHSAANFEIVTGYMRSEFTSAWSFDPSNNNILGVSNSALPTIVGTPDQQYAMGIYVPDLSQRGGYYGYAGFPDADPNNATYKWNAVMLMNNGVPVQNYSYRAYVIVGTLTDVRASMVRLYQLNHLVNPAVFNASWYLSHYPDLQAAFGSDTSAATQHWLSHGIGEGRQGSIWFVSSEYLSMYGDLSAAFGSGNYQAAIQHFISNGMSEGRAGRYAMSPAVFNGGWYEQKYPDLLAAFGNNPAAVAEHWLSHGISEGRQGTSKFSPHAYLARYSDLTAAFGATNYTAAIQHYITNGIREGRDGR